MGKDKDQDRELPKDIQEIVDKIDDEIEALDNEDDG